MNLGGPELLIILLIVLLLFGGAKLPKLAKSIGEAKREFERSSSDDDPKSKNANSRQANEKSDANEKSGDAVDTTGTVGNDANNG